MKNKTRKKPNYGVQAPKDLLVFISLTVIFLLGFLLIPGWWKYLFLTLFVCFLYMTALMLINSTNWYRDKLSRFIVDQCKVNKGSKVLDVGCGSGSLSIAFTRQVTGGEVWGIDVWKKGDLSGNIPERVLENIRIEGVENIVKVKTADAREIPFPDNYFDAIGSVYVLHNIHPNREKAVFEMIRVLKPGGILAIAEGGIPWWVKYDVLPKLLKEKTLKNARFQRCLLTKIFLAEKG
ncbi:MAG: class I SAM-dependent methyltransferase [Thermodesulfobacteriota bacterium]